MRALLSVAAFLPAVLSGCFGSVCPPSRKISLDEGEYQNVEDGTTPFDESVSLLTVEGDLVTFVYEDNGRQIEVQWEIER